MTGFDTSPESPQPEPDSIAASTFPPPPGPKPVADPDPDPEPVDSPVGAVGKAAGRYKGRFIFFYGALTVVLVGAVAGFLVLVSGGAFSSSSPKTAWSNWKPETGTSAKMATEIANHVSREYHLNKKGTQLVSVVPGPPTITSGKNKIAVSTIALKGSSSSHPIQIIPTATMWSDQLCGIPSHTCSITGKPTADRGRLVRREALEVALYTFKFVPGIDSIVAFMPPPNGQPQSTLLYLQKSAFAKELAQPLSKTLPLAAAPLPNTPDTKEAQTIDKLTDQSIYMFTVQQLQDQSVLLVLAPFQS